MCVDEFYVNQMLILQDSSNNATREFVQSLNKYSIDRLNDISNPIVNTLGTNLLKSTHDSRHVLV